MAVGDIAALTAEQLALLQDEAADALRCAKTTCDWLDGAVALKYGDRAHASRQAEGDDPAEYVDIAIKVPERKFAAWPSHIRSAFEGARTVRTGKPSFRLSLTNEVTS